MKQAEAGKPFFIWMNTTRMHFFTHVRESMQGQSGMPGNDYADGMIEHDGDVGKLLKALDDLDIADNTIVVYTTDNGPNQFSWPDAATTPFRNEKDTNWEGAFRVPAMVRWPGKIKPGQVSNEMFSGHGLVPDLAGRRWRCRREGQAAARASTIGDTDFKVHLDGYNQLPYLTGETPTRARARSSTTSTMTACWSPMRYRQLEGRVLRAARTRRLQGLERTFDCLRVPKIFNLRMDPYERADIVSDQYDDWRTKNAYYLGYMRRRPATFLQTFIEYPPSQKPASFSIDQIEAAIEAQSAPSCRPSSRPSRRSSGPWASQGGDDDPGAGRRTRGRKIMHMQIIWISYAFHMGKISRFQLLEPDLARCPPVTRSSPSRPP